MGNDNHDPENGQFSSGGGGGAGAGAGAAYAGKTGSITDRLAARKDAANQKSKGGGKAKGSPADAHDNMDRNAAVAHHASTLTATMGDNEKFDQALSNLEKDKSIGKDAMRQVAQQFLGREKMRPSIGRAGAIKEIRQRQAINARQDARAANIQSMKSW